MERPALTPTTHHNGLLPDREPAPSKQDGDVICLTVHLYNRVKAGGGCGAKGSESTLTFPAGEYIAEELCTSAAKACGKSQDDFSCGICPHTLFNTAQVDAATVCPRCEISAAWLRFWKVLPFTKGVATWCGLQNACIKFLHITWFCQVVPRTFSAELPFEKNLSPPPNTLWPIFCSLTLLQMVEKRRHQL